MQTFIKALPLVCLSYNLSAADFQQNIQVEKKSCIQQATDNCINTICANADDPECANKCLKDAQEDCKDNIKP